MIADPAPQCPVLGFRQDRIGARIVGLLNVLRLAQDYQIDARFVWLSKPNGPYPDLIDPCRFLARDFVERHLLIVADKPDLSARHSLSADAARMDRDLFAKSLRKGACYHSDAAFGILRMIDESPADIRARIATIMAGLPLSTRLEAALDRARETLFALGQGASPVAIHVRRGDLLDGMPWSQSSWPAKYVPDEFFRAWVARQHGPVIAFSDTPAALTHLAQGDDRIIPAQALLDGADLSVAERDLLDLMLMAGCARIGAPSGSAFSRAAEIVGLAQVDALPGDLPREDRVVAYDALLDRVIKAPDSFFAPGDLAQSTQYAGEHAQSVGRGPELIAATRDRGMLCEAHPFVDRILAATAMAAGDTRTAQDLAGRAMTNPRLQTRDRAQLRRILDFIDLPQQGEGDAADRMFLGEIFRKDGRTGRIINMLSEQVLGRAGRARTVLMIHPQLSDLMRETTSDDPASSPILPDWAYLADWDELFNDESARAPILLFPDLPGKLRQIGGRGPDVEAVMDLSEGRETPPLPGSEDAALIGLYAACLSLHGRFRRALRLHHWLNDCLPDDPLTHKRLSDSCFRLRNLTAGMNHLDRALELARNNPLLHLSKARRMADQGRRRGAELHLSRARALWPDLPLNDQQARIIFRALDRADRDRTAAS